MSIDGAGRSELQLRLLEQLVPPMLSSHPTVLAPASPQLPGEQDSMIADVTVGADDSATAERYYSAFLPALG